MVTQTTTSRINYSVSSATLQEDPASQLRTDYESIKRLFNRQPKLIQRFLETQASQVVQGLLHHQSPIHFELPNRIVADSDIEDQTIPLVINENNRQQVIGGFLEHMARADTRTLLRQRLSELEHSSEPGIALATRLLRYATAAWLINQILPAGNRITYIASDGEDIPSIPTSDGEKSSSALIAWTDAIVEDEAQEKRGELQVPYAHAARLFFLPQWVAFDDQGRLLLNSIQEAEAHIASMQNYLQILHTSVSLAPYMVADPTYQQKRYGMLGQLVNQGRAFAAYETRQIIYKIKKRAANQDLNQGLSLSLPYFDDQMLQIKENNFDVIPAGRIMFVPAFVVRAARQEQAKVAQDTRLSPSTRKYLLYELQMLEATFA